MEPLQKILFISFDHVGDMLRFTPFLKTLRQTYPQAYVTCLLSKGPGEILKHCPFVDEILFFPHDEIRREMKEGMDLSRYVEKYSFRLLQTLKQMQFDLVINPFSDLGAVIAGAIRPKRILGRGMASWGQYKLFGENAARFYHTMRRQNELRVYSDQLFSDAVLTLLKDLEIDPKNFCREPELFLGKQDRVFAASFLRQSGVVADDLLIGFQTGALLNLNRMWPLQNFVALANELFERLEEKYRHNLKFVLLGTASERKQLEKNLVPFLKSKWIMAAGETTILQSGALIEKLDLLVSIDTGPMHMAAALKIPLVALLGRMTCVPLETRPNGAGHSVLIGKNIAAISVNEVVIVTLLHLYRVLRAKKELISERV